MASRYPATLVGSLLVVNLFPVLECAPRDTRGEIHYLGIFLNDGTKKAGEEKTKARGFSSRTR